MIEIEHGQSGACITLPASGTLTRADFDRALPEIENAMVLAKSPLKLIIRLEEFHGLKISALWEDLKFGLGHVGEFGSIAVVGDTNLKELAAWLASLFTQSDLRYFNFDGEDEARNRFELM